MGCWSQPACGRSHSLPIDHICAVYDGTKKLTEACLLVRRDCFDAVYGSSAGAINLTYFLTNQIEGVDIYHEDIACERFCDMRRLLNKNEGVRLSRAEVSAQSLDSERHHAVDSAWIRADAESCLPAGRPTLMVILSLHLPLKQTA